MTDTATSALTDVAHLLRQLGESRGGPEEIKACCVTAYGLDVVGLFLGESYHPGGSALTRRMADALALKPGERVLDVAAGIGTTAFLLAEERNVEVTGVDLGKAQVAKARATTVARGLSGRVRFDVGDAECLPADDAGFDAVICECAFCTFPSKEQAATEIARVLTPGGRVGITDVWIEPDRLDPDLAGLAGRISCIADARPIHEVRSFVEGAGLSVTLIERHDEALAATITQVETRLRALRIADLPFLRSFDIARGVEIARKAKEMVGRGDAGYMLLVATKP